MPTFSVPEGPWQGQVGRVREWYEPHLERRYEAAHVRLGDLVQLERIAHQFATPTKPLELAQELIAEGRFQGPIVMDPPREASPAGAAPAATAAGEYVTPKPRKAGA